MTFIYPYGNLLIKVDGIVRYSEIINMTSKKIKGEQQLTLTFPGLRYLDGKTSRKTILKTFKNNFHKDIKDEKINNYPWGYDEYRYRLIIDESEKDIIDKKFMEGFEFHLPTHESLDKEITIHIDAPKTINGVIGTVVAKKL